MCCAARLGSGSAIAKRDRAVAVSTKDDTEPRKHCRSYIFLESIFWGIYIEYLGSFVKEDKAGNEGREKRRSGGKGIFVPLQV